jgi:hypothetical protein
LEHPRCDENALGVKDKGRVLPKRNYQVTTWLHDNFSLVDDDFLNVRKPPYVALNPYNSMS